MVERVEKTKGKISAKRLLPVAQSGRLQRLGPQLPPPGGRGEGRVAKQRITGAGDPGVWTPGDMVVFDWGEIGPLFVFCAVLAWSRVRFVYFADNLGAEATMTALARCFEYLGAVPKTALTDRMGCLKGDTVAGLVVPDPGLRALRHPLRLPARLLRRSRPRVQGAGREPGRLREVRPDDPRRAAASPTWPGPTSWAWRGATRSTRSMHSEICAVPAERLVNERRADGHAAVPAGQHRQAGRSARSTGSAACASARPATRCRRRTSVARSSSSPKTDDR